MSEFTYWKTVSVRVGLLVAIRRLEEKPTQVVNKLLTEYVLEQAKERGIIIDDVVSALDLEPSTE